ncbi:MAG: hypothetical protein ACPHER_07965 [Nevskiales bacterium]
MSTASARPGFGTILAFSLRRNWWPAWITPWVITLVLVPAYVNGLINVPKAPGEIMAPFILGFALLVSIYRLTQGKSAWMLWYSLLLFTFLCREFHFAGTSAAVYIGALTLFWVAWYRYPVYAAYWGSRRVITLFSTALFCYFTAVGLDSHWWKFLPGDKYHWANVEEYVEVTGHLFLLTLAFIAKPVDDYLTAS